MDFGKEYYEFSKNFQNFDMKVSGEWQKQYAQAIIQTFELQKHHKCLDVGSAMGAQLEGFAKHGIVFYGADVSQWYIDNCTFPQIKQRIGVIVDNKIPFENEQFDFVQSSQTVEHIPEADIKPLLMDIKRTMKDGAILYISTVEPIAEGYDEKDKTHISCFERSKWEAIFEECGFKNVTWEYEPRLLEHKIPKDSQWVNFMLQK